MKNYVPGIYLDRRIVCSISILLQRLHFTTKNVAPMEMFITAKGPPFRLSLLGFVPLFCLSIILFSSDRSSHSEDVPV